MLTQHPAKQPFYDPYLGGGYLLSSSGEYAAPAHNIREFVLSLEDEHKLIGPQETYLADRVVCQERRQSCLDDEQIKYQNSLLLFSLGISNAARWRDFTGKTPEERIGNHYANHVHKVKIARLAYDKERRQAEWYFERFQEVDFRTLLRYINKYPNLAKTYWVMMQVMADELRNKWEKTEFDPEDPHKKERRKNRLMRIIKIADNASQFWRGGI